MITTTVCHRARDSVQSKWTDNINYWYFMFCSRIRYTLYTLYLELQQQWGKRYLCHRHNFKLDYKLVWISKLARSKLRVTFIVKYR